MNVDYFKVKINSNKPYVYALFNENNEPFYIGKGRNGRVNHHLRKSNLKKKSRKNNEIDRILKVQGYVSRDILCYFESDSDALLFENYLINLYKTVNQGGTLTNVATELVDVKRIFNKSKPSIQLVSDDDIIAIHSRWLQNEIHIEDCAVQLGIKRKTVSEIFRGKKRSYLNLPKKSLRKRRKSLIDVDFNSFYKDRFENKLSYSQLSLKYKIPKTTVSNICKISPRYLEEYNRYSQMHHRSLYE